MTKVFGNEAIEASSKLTSVKRSRVRGKNWDAQMPVGLTHLVRDTGVCGSLCCESCCLMTIFSAIFFMHIRALTSSADGHLFGVHPYLWLIVIGLAYLGACAYRLCRVVVSGP